MSEVIYDEILGKLRTAEVGGGTGGGGGTSYVFDASQFTVSGDSVSITGTVPSAEVASGVTSSAVDYRLTVSGGVASFNPIANIVNATGATVTLEPDTAYKVQATTSAVTLNANPPASGQWGLEGHIELFVAGTGYVVTGSNVVLANALEPDAVNNCTVRFHDGIAIISVEDHVAGYIVTVNAASGDGSLAYGLATATNEYISVDASLNGQTLDLAGATTNAEKHVVGNGYTETIVSGGISCTSKTTFSNLSMQNVAVNGGTMTLGDVNIPSGSTVSGNFVIEKVTIDGSLTCSSVSASGTPRIAGSGTLALTNGLSFMYYGAATTGYHLGASGITITSGKIEANRELNFSNCVFNGSTYPSNSAAILANPTTVNLSGCTFTPFAFTNAIVTQGGVANIENCDFGTNCNIRVQNASSAVPINMQGVVKMKSILADAARTATLNLASGMTLDLTGNSNSAVAAPGGGIVVGGAITVITSAGASVSIAGGTYTKINNDGTTE